MKTILEGLRKIIYLLEKNEVPARVQDHEKLMGMLEKELNKYFQGLEDAIPWAEIENLYYRFVKTE